MTSRILDDYLAEFRRQVRHLPQAQREQVLADVRAHLAEDIAERRREDRLLTADEAALQATEAFGDPADLGVAYGAQGGVVRKSTGQVLLRVAALTGRGVARTVGGVLKWTVVAGLVLLGLAVVAGIAFLFVAGDLLEEYEDEIASSVPRPIYGYADSFALPQAETSLRTDAFQVSTDATGFDLTIDVAPQTGCLAIQVLAPDGTPAYGNGQGCGATRQQLHFAQQGTWRVQYTFAAFTGTVSVAAYEYRSATPG